MTEKQYEEYINKYYKKENKYHTSQYSEPLYICPKCGGCVRKNLLDCIALTSSPPIIEYKYECDNQECDYVKYLMG